MDGSAWCSTLLALIKLLQVHVLDISTEDLVIAVVNEVVHLGISALGLVNNALFLEEGAATLEIGTLDWAFGKGR